MEIQNFAYKSGLSGNIDLIEIDKLIYKLITLFASSKEIDNFANNTNDPLLILKSKFETSEIIITLSNIALLTRNFQETFISKKKLSEIIVGKLITFEEVKNNEENLNFKEACNKIIHSIHINFDIIENEKNESCYLLPQLFLYGEYQNKEWKAELDVYEFCRTAYRSHI